MYTYRTENRTRGDNVLLCQSTVPNPLENSRNFTYVLMSTRTHPTLRHTFHKASTI